MKKPERPVSVVGGYGLISYLITNHILYRLIEIISRYAFYTAKTTGRHEKNSASNCFEALP